MNNLAAKGLLIAGTSVLAIAGAVAMPNAANAIGITYTLNNVIFNNTWTQNNSVNGGAASSSNFTATSPTVNGTFIYDPVTGLATNVNLALGANFNGTKPIVGGSEFLNINALTVSNSAKTLSFSLNTPLSAATVTNNPDTSSPIPSVLGTGNYTTKSKNSVTFGGTGASKAFTFTLATALGSQVSPNVYQNSLVSSQFVDTYKKTDTYTTQTDIDVTVAGVLNVGSYPGTPSSSITINSGTLTATGNTGSLTGVPVPFEFEGTGAMALVGGAWFLRNRYLKKKATKV